MTRYLVAAMAFWAFAYIGWIVRPVKVSRSPFFRDAESPEFV